MRRVQVVIPIGEAEPDLGLCLQSLAKHMECHCPVYLIGNAAAEDACETLQTCALDVKHARSFSDAWTAGNDLLLVDPRTEVTQGFLEEMSAVLHLHERHAVVTPRTNSAPCFALAQVSEAYDVWLNAHAKLLRYQIVPAAGCFCMLIKSEIIERFGFFDGSLSSYHDQAHDFICRINRCGYSALLANRAFVFYREPAFAREYVRSVELTRRYPEFDRRIADYHRFQVDPLETFATLGAPHRPRVLYDLSHLLSQYSGTSDFALHLLREIAPLTSEYDLYVGANERQAFFLPELQGYRFFDETAGPPMVFDLVYKPCHMFRWQEFARLTRLAPRVAFTLLDMIAVRCDYIGNASAQILVRKSVELADLVFSISEFSRSDFAAFYSMDAQMQVIHLSSHVRLQNGTNPRGEYVLIMGNSLAHKGVSEAVSELKGEWPITVLGGEDKQSHANVRWLTSGKLSRRAMYELLAGARVLVYPSHYEGFGLPAVDALALGKPVIALDTAVNREISKNTGDRNLRLVSSPKELREAARRAWLESPYPANPAPRRWLDTGKDYVSAFSKLLAKDIDVDKLRQRWDTVRLAETAVLG